MFNLTNFLKSRNPLNLFYRTYYHNKHNKKYLHKNDKDRKLVNGTIYYYPRRANEVEPEIVPSKMFRVHRIKSLRGNPYWERQILREFGLFDGFNCAVVKNIPENNARLWKIKHLVKITPINFPNGEPTAEDINRTYLKENGDCVVIKDISSLTQRLEAAQEFEQNKSTPNSDIKKRESRLNWVNHWS